MECLVRDRVGLRQRRPSEEEGEDVHRYGKARVMRSVDCTRCREGDGLCRCLNLVSFATTRHTEESNALRHARRQRCDGKLSGIVVEDVVDQRAMGHLSEAGLNRPLELRAHGSDIVGRGNRFDVARATLQYCS